MLSISVMPNNNNTEQIMNLVLCFKESVSLLCGKMTIFLIFFLKSVKITLSGNKYFFIFIID